MAASIEDVANAMFEIVKDGAGSKKYKPSDLTKMMVEKLETDKKTCKAAIKELVNSGRLVYTYFGGSFLEIPHKEGAAPD
ncbi:MAG: hypothetical protein GXP49_18850 [Deltaproteobacteria bacterium]|nr:hypothetical protein [Deltaproteobacteria bacterium]